MAAIEDAEERRQLKRQAYRVYRESTAVALLVTGVVMLTRGLMGM